MKLSPLLLLILLSCGSYKDPNQEKLTYFKCEKDQTVVVKHADDYESIRLKVGKEQLLLHHFVIDSGQGYRSENYLWLVKGKQAKLMTLKKDGTEAVVLGDCVSQKSVLEF